MTAAPRVGLASLPRAVLIVLLVTALLPALPPATASEALSREQLLARIAAARGLAAEGVTDPSPGRMEQVRRTLGLPLELRVEGARVRVEPDPYLAGIRGEHADDFHRVVEHLETLDAEMRRTGPPASADERVAGALERAYAGVRTSPSLWERVRAWFGRVMQRLLDWIARAGNVSPNRVVAWVLVGGIAVGIVLLLRRIRVVPHHELESAGRDRDDGGEWRRLAEESENSGDLARALKARYRLLLAALATRGVLRDAPSLTPSECRRSVRAKLPAAYLPVAEATHGFERVFYAQASPQAEDVRAMRAAEEAVRTA